jgi:nucleolar protein 14
MAGSQLKRLKASLRDQGIIGPQQSKKQKKRLAQDEKAKTDKRLSRATKLEGIREQFNPFDLKHNVRGPKFEVTSNRPATDNAAKGIYGRPTEAKAAGEERRRETLLVEMQRRNKVGGILDRRFGEDNADMTPEEKALERFALEKQRSHKKAVFDLEDEDMGGGFGLTHMGKSLSLDGPSVVDDYQADDIDADSDDDEGDDGRKAPKRKLLAEGEGEADGDQPERKKTKAEIYKEVIAKSKYHKAERQAQKDEDEDLRDELDQELKEGGLHALLFSSLKGKDRKDEAPEKGRLEQEYDFSIKKLAQDRRAAPTDKTKTEDELAEEQASKLRDLETKRKRRMEGLAEESESEEDEEPEQDDADAPIQFIEKEEDDGFGLGKGIKMRPTATEMGLDDEDDFLIEDGLIAEGSDLSLSEISDNDEDEDESEVAADDEDDEFTKGLLNEEEKQNPAFTLSLDASADGKKADADGLHYVFPCPQIHEEFLDITKDVPTAKLPVVVQRIRALHHSKLESGNKAKLGNFARVLVQHLSHLALSKQQSFATLESLIRHLHSLSKTYAVEIATELRSHLEQIGERPLDLNVGDLVILTAIGTIFPTSDHFHQVATPAMLTITRYLGMKIPRRVSDYTIGIYLCILAVQYQTVSKRYVPEVMNFSLNTLAALAPVKSKDKLGYFPLHEPAEGVRIHKAENVTVRKLSCLDCAGTENDNADVKVALIGTTIKLLEAAAVVWTGKSAFSETFQPASNVLGHLSSKACRAHLPKSLNGQINKSKTKLDGLLRLAHMERRTLELHHHRPLAIKSHVPKFEDTYDPDKHYDPDRERAELAKLRAEHKRERKGALRELRKDANFTAREKLRVKKAKDAAYEKKYKRLVAEIQGEEGREANAYEREKAQRKRAAKRG